MPRFPVPVFFFLSGLAAGIATSAGRETSLLKRALRTAIPYLVYSLAYTTLAYATGGLTGLSVKDVAVRVVRGEDAKILWFLASLTIVAPLSVLLWKRWGGRFLVVAVVLSLAARAIYSYSIALKSAPSTAARLVIIPMGLYAAGLWWSRPEAPLRKSYRRRPHTRAGRSCLMLSVVEMYVAEFVIQPHWTISQQSYASLTAGSALLCIGVDLVASAGVLASPMRALSQLPRVTLGVYCLQIAFLGYIPLFFRAETSSTAWALVAGSAALLGAATWPRPPRIHRSSESSSHDGHHHREEDDALPITSAASAQVRERIAWIEGDEMGGRNRCGPPARARHPLP